MLSRKRDRWDSLSDEECGFNVNHILTNRGDPAVVSLCNLSVGDTVSAFRETGQKYCVSDECTQLLSSEEKHNILSQPSMLTMTRHNPLLQGCRLVYDCYERLARLDEGTYGIVWKARDTNTNEMVALKQIKFDTSLMKEGFPLAALREIGVLLALSHECIVTVKEMAVGDAFDKVFMVMEFMEMNLQEAMKRCGTNPFPQSELKNMFHQILSAAHHIHDKWILHRDLKTSNILVHKSGKIALCDFGLARKYQIPKKALTQMVITLWYRPPELLFGESVYGPEVDMWSIGCIFGELLTKEAILQGRGELDQIDLIFKLLGAPTRFNWSGFASLPNASTFRWKKKDGSNLKNRFPVNSFSGNQTFLDPNGFDLLGKLLILDPALRISAREALNHRYFKEGVEMQTPCFSCEHYLKDILK